MDRYQELESALQKKRTALIEHPLYDELKSVVGLRVFMEHHVFAVWDFMSLLKMLQRELTSLEVPWRPAENRQACRLINEIVLAEESDINNNGEPASHFEMYVDAMKAAGADTASIRKVGFTASDEELDESLKSLPECVQQFINATFSVVRKNDLCEIASAFTFGRENLLPDVFEKLVAAFNQESKGGLDEFEYYLQRHIELDGGEHGDMAKDLLNYVCGDDDDKWRRALLAAEQALDARKTLWDGIAQEVRLQEKAAAVS